MPRRPAKCEQMTTHQDGLTVVRVNLPASHIAWLQQELGAKSYGEMLKALCLYATTPEGKSAVRASGFVPRLAPPPIIAG